MLKNKTILITGGTGSFGKKLTELLVKFYKPKKIIIYSRDELKQFEMQKKLPGDKKTNIRYFIGDTRDLPRLKLATEKVNIVIHAAALKHVPTSEYNPFEVVKTNVLGAQNVIDACIENNVEKVIALSTDKASSPINLYGATKLTQDKLFIAANNYASSKKTKFSVVRYGNVMSSRGSVVPLFLQMKEKGFFTITDKRMTRFNITLEQGVKFVLLSLKEMWGGEIFVPKIPSYKITDIAKAISTKCKIKYIGLRAGEKLNEEMISSTESMNTVEFKNYYVILPNSEFLNWNKKEYLRQHKKGKVCRYSFSYTSATNNNFLSIKDLRKLIKDN